jgi:hypothetical protein
MDDRYPVDCLELRLIKAGNLQSLKEDIIFVNIQIKNDNKSKLLMGDDRPFFGHPSAPFG